MSIRRILFVGMYPDEVNKYRNVFFQNLIYAIADEGVECTVISPVSLTKYRKNIDKVSKMRIDYTPSGNSVLVYHPRYISFSSKKIACFNTGVLSEYFFQKAALDTYKKIHRSFDCVYGHFFLSGGLAGVKIAQIDNLPIFIAYGECDYDTEIVKLYRRLKKEDIVGLNGIISVSTNNANILKSKNIFDNIPVLIAPNAIDNTIFVKLDKEKCRNLLGIPNDKFIVGFVGGFEDRKGDKRLLKAVNQLEDVFLAYAGRGENRPIGEKVLFCKSLSHDEIPTFLNAVDVFALPTKAEGSCNAVVEAMACSLPIISSDLPFNDDVLNNDNSIKINPESIEEIRDAIIKMKDDRVYREKLAKNALISSQKLHIDLRAKRILGFMNNNIERVEYNA